MADQTPPGPKTSGRIAGVIAIVALAIGGYYGFIAKPAPGAGGTEAASAPAPAEPKAEAGPESKAEVGAEPKTEVAAGGPAGGADAPALADAATPAAGDAAKDAVAGSAAKDAPAAKPEGEAATKSPDVTVDNGPAADGPGPVAEAGAPIAAPSFDVVRVEPSGEAVVAGLAEPKSTVELLDGSTSIAKGEANERGEWAIVVEKPLAPGTHDLSIRTTSPDKKTETLSEQRVAIAVPEPGKGEALVVLNEPNAPSRVIQLPDEPKPGETTVASAEPTPPAADKPAADADATVAASTSEGGNAAAPAAPAATADAGSTAPAAAADKPADADGAVASNEDGTAPEGGSTADAGSTAPAVTADKPVGEKGADVAVAASDAGTGEAGKDAAGSTAPPAVAADSGTPGLPKTADEGATAPDKPADVAQNAPAEPTPAPAPVIEPKVTVDAVEFEDGTIYIAGSSATGGTVRIYVDGVAVGDTQTAEGGRWLIEKKHELAPGQHTVRADHVDKATGNVVVRAEVPFEQTVDVAILSPVTTEGGSADGASASNAMPAPQNVIIRRGDNLWTISRRLYGKGIRFSTIYEANNDQIRDPHWIYPGQVFMLPAGDARWTN